MSQTSGAMGLIAVHGGAGLHDPKDDRHVKRALQAACLRALEVLQRDGAAADMVEEAIAVLEDDENLNAGYGSNLTIDGRVECDASLMEGDTSAFGSAGSVSGVKNTIRLARAILDYAKRPDSLGRIPPLTLVSAGATAFASSIASSSSGSSITLVPPETLIAPRAEREWRHWSARLEAASSTTHPPEAQGELPNLHDRQDTVGAVALDTSGRLAAGVSRHVYRSRVATSTPISEPPNADTRYHHLSGGLLLKLPGRLGEAAVYGAGCFSRTGEDDDCGVACSVSGAGELIVRAGLARVLGDAIISAHSTQPNPASEISGLVHDQALPPESLPAGMPSDVSEDESDAADDDWDAASGADTHSILAQTLEDALRDGLAHLPPPLSAGVALTTSRGSAVRGRHAQKCGCHSAGEGETPRPARRPPAVVCIHHAKHGSRVRDDSRPRPKDYDSSPAVGGS